jgi:PTS system glucose-specific IIA component
MLDKLFGKKKKITEEQILASVDGQFVAIEEVPDPTFAQKMMGDGVAIQPTNGNVVAPIEGEVIQVFPTKHAVGLRGRSGMELLIHIGLETVSMNGEGFQAHVKAGDKVKPGQPLITFDLDLVNEKAVSSIIPMVITNMERVDSFEKASVTDLKAGETTLALVKLK